MHKPDRVNIGGYMQGSSLSFKTGTTLGSTTLTENLTLRASVTKNEFIQTLRSAGLID